MHPHPTPRRVTSADVRRSQEYADVADHVLGRALRQSGVAADSTDPMAGGVSMSDRQALGVAVRLAQQSHRSYTGAEVIGLAMAQGHQFESPSILRAAGVAADEAPVGRDTDRIATVEKPRKARVLTDRLSLYTPADTALQVRHDEVIESFQAVVFSDSGEQLPITQPPKFVPSDPADLYMIGYERSANWTPLGGIQHIHRGPATSVESEGMADALELLYLSGHSALPSLRSLSSDPRTLSTLVHEPADGVTYTPSTPAEQDGMLNDLRAFFDAVGEANEGAFGEPDTLFIGYGVAGGLERYARDGGLDTSSMAQVRAMLRERGIELVRTPRIGRRALLTRTAGVQSAIVRIGDAAARLLHTYTDRTGTHTILGMRTGGLYTVWGAESVVMDAPE